MDSDELRIGHLTVRIDRLLCVGFETCAQVAPALFRLDDEGIAVFQPEAGLVPEELVLESCRSCPVDAIEVFDASGSQLVP